MTVVLQAATPGDREAMLVLERDLFPHDAWSAELFDTELAHLDSYYLVGRADNSGELVAYGGLRAPFFAGGQGDIQTLAVAPDYRRRGIARDLLRALLLEAERRHVAEVFLEVRVDNEPAKFLYESEGFREIARRPGYYQPGFVDAVVMRKTMGQEGGHRD